MAIDKLFKGIQQVMSLPTNPEQGVIYLVGNGQKGGKGTGIYFGTRWYGKTLDDTAVKELITRLGTAEGKISDIETTLGDFTKQLTGDLKTVAEVVANHESRLGVAEGNASAAVATANSAKSIAESAKTIAEGAVADVTAQVQAAQDAQAAAEGFASAADQSAKDAAAAKGAAETAKGLAESAKAGAVEAQDAAEDARDAAEGHASTASTKAGEASASATLAGEKATAADQSAKDAAAAKGAAETAKGLAETAANTAAGERDNAELAAEAAESAKTAAEAAKKAAEDSNTSATAIATKAAEDAAKAMEDAAAALDSVKDGANFKGKVDELPKSFDDYNNGDMIVVGADEYIAYKPENGTPDWILLGNINPALDQITSSIEELDADVNSEGGAYISLNVVEVDGKITKVTVDDSELESVVNESHEHANKEELDKFNDGDKEKWDKHVAATDIHVTTANKNKWDEVADRAIRAVNFYDNADKYIEIELTADQTDGTADGHLYVSTSIADIKETEKKLADAYAVKTYVDTQISTNAIYYGGDDAE